MSIVENVNSNIVPPLILKPFVDTLFEENEEELKGPRLFEVDEDNDNLVMN